MTQKDKEVDLLIKRVIQSEMENSSPPISTDKAWEQLNMKLNNRQSRFKQSRFYKNKLFYAIAIIFISLVIILSPQTSSAYNTIVEVFQKVQENVTQLFIKVEDKSPANENAPITDDMYIIDEDELISLELDLEEAQKETVFSITQPKFVPEEYTLKDVTVYKSENEKSDDIILHYEGNEGSFNIEQKVFGESFSAGLTIDNNDTQIESVDIHEHSGSLLQYKNGFLELIWVTESYYYSISGALSKDQVIKIAKSM